MEALERPHAEVRAVGRQVWPPGVDRELARLRDLELEVERRARRRARRSPGRGWPRRPGRGRGGGAGHARVTAFHLIEQPTGLGARPAPARSPREHRVERVAQPGRVLGSGPCGRRPARPRSGSAGRGRGRRRAGSTWALQARAASWSASWRYGKRPVLGARPAPASPSSESAGIALGVVRVDGEERGRRARA